MIRRLIALLAVLGLAMTATPAFAQQRAQAVFAGGCFWCMEHDMKAIPGVLEVMSGYTGGKEKHPTYEQVSSERTGHYESVRVTYDPAKVTYEQILSRYWRLIDPTDNGGQFCDRGPPIGRRSSSRLNKGRSPRSPCRSWLSQRRFTEP